MLKIITHRGLEPSKKDFFVESSLEAFRSHLERGFGIEFDPYFDRENEVFVSHHVITQEHVSPLLREVLDLVSKFPEPLCALHLKGKFQKIEYLKKLVSILQEFPTIYDRLLIFDVKLSTAKYLKKKISELILAPSVAHEYDIERFNAVTSETLMPVREAIKYKDLYDWVWLDEWDRLDINGGNKILYCTKTFTALRKAGFKIGLVTPELHCTSPGLLGRESHSDAVNREILFNRITEIIELHPDAVCSDYPEEIKTIYLEI